MEKKRVASLLGLKEKELEIALAALAEQFRGRGLALIESEHEVELRTASAAADIVKKLRENELSRDLGKASLETLAVIAYQAEGTDGGSNGATRGEVDWVRGVNSSTSLRTLLMRALIEGREDPKDRRRIRYSLTTETLAHLGLAKAGDLPRFSELARAAKEVIDTESAAVAATAASE